MSISNKAKPHFCSNLRIIRRREVCRPHHHTSKMSLLPLPSCWFRSFWGQVCMEAVFFLLISPLHWFVLLFQLYLFSLGMAPWGFCDAELEAAISSGAVNDMAFWRNMAWSPPPPPPRQPVQPKIGSGQLKAQKAKSPGGPSKGLGAA